jgi:thiamine biosynthesis lipoprotein
MGTSWTVKLLYPNSKVSQAVLMASIQEALTRITLQMSTWDAGSTISQLNLAQPGWYQLPAEFFHVLSHALDVARASSGAYDPTLGQLVDQWGFGPAGPITATPDEPSIASALANTGWRRTVLNPEHRAVWQPGGLHFDLSSIAKGYGVDQIAAVLDQHHVEHYLVEVGGELKARGRRTDDSPWTVAIEVPQHTERNAGAPQSKTVAASTLAISLNDYAIATSGDYRRHVDLDGRRYAHTLDPATGSPLVHKLVSVSVLHPQCMLADALATALLSMGPQRGPAYARRSAIPALFIHRHSSGLAVEWTAGFQSFARNSPSK